VIACVDVHYTQTAATAASVLFYTWADDHSCSEVIERIGYVAPYQPGNFYLRELPCLTAVLAKVRDRPEVVLIDGYVWLGDDRHPGLGARLYKALGMTSAVVGVAKSHFRDGPSIQKITRGKSSAPLFISAVGIDLEDAAAHIRKMHGHFRIPTLLKRVDRLCRAHRAFNLSIGCL
jgi:deoxyribonuclease V